MMQQQYCRTCMVVDHKSKVIEYVCMFLQCQLKRFLCTMCCLGTSHKHDQQDNSHIVDNSDFYEKINKKLSQAKGKQQEKKFDIDKSIVPLKQLIQEIQNLFKNVQHITQQVEQGVLQNLNINRLETQLLNAKKHGFNQIDDQELNDLINMPQQQDLDVYKQLEEQSNQIIQNALKIKEWRLSQVVINQKSSLQRIKDAKYQIQQIEDTGDEGISTGAISNDQKYVVSGGEDKLLKILGLQNILANQIDLIE